MRKTLLLSAALVFAGFAAFAADAPRTPQKTSFGKSDMEAAAAPQAAPSARCRTPQAKRMKECLPQQNAHETPKG